MKKAIYLLSSAILCICSTHKIQAASLAIDSLTGPITQNEIDSFKAYMATQVPPPNPWTVYPNTISHNTWADGYGGNNLEAMGMMYEATGDITILTNMIYWADTCVSERNDLMSAANGGQRVMWTGKIDKVWCPNSPTNSAATYAGGENGDTKAHILYTALLILKNPSLWNQTVPDGDPYGYGTTYLQRAQNYVARCDEANDEYDDIFVQSDNTIGDPPNWPSGFHTMNANNIRAMMDGDFERSAQCHEILGDDPSRLAYDDTVVQADSSACINGMAGYNPSTVNGDSVYDWGYYPTSVYPADVENVGHGAYDALGVWRVYSRSVYNYSLSTVQPFANAVVDVMNVSANSFSGNVDGSGATQNYMQQQWLLLADLNPSVYSIIAQADYASGRYRTSPYMTATILWMKNRIYQEFSVAAAPASQTVNAGSGTSYTITISPLGGFGGTVSLSASGLPSGASASFNPSSVNLSTLQSVSTTVTMTISTSSSTPTGSDTITVTGTSGSVSQSANVALTVNPASSFSGIYQLQNEASGMVLNNQGSLTNGSAITQWTITTSSNLDWQFIPTSGGYYQINSCKSGKDAVVKGASTASGAGIIQWSFGSSGDDQWEPVQNSDGSYTFYNLHSGLVLEDPAFSTNKTTQMDQWSANGGSNQKWVLIKQ